MKNSKGITLVALVVTIIVLLILAGVSLSLVAGGNGIMTRASNAADTNYDKSAQEAAELLIAQATTEYYEVIYAGGTSSITDNASTTDVNELEEAKASLPAYVNAYLNVSAAQRSFTGGSFDVTNTSAGRVSITVSQTGDLFHAIWNGNATTGYTLGAWESGS